MLVYAVRKRNCQWKVRAIQSSGIEDGRARIAGPVALRPRAFATVREAKEYVAEQEASGGRP